METRQSGVETSSAEMKTHQSGVDTIMATHQSGGVWFEYGTNMEIHQSGVEMYWVEYGQTSRCKSSHGNLEIVR